MIVFRPHRGGLREAMLEAKYYSSLGYLVDNLVSAHNEAVPYFHITADDLAIKKYTADSRVGWHDTFAIMYESYDNISDKDGYLRYFGGEVYEHPCCPLGFFTTDFCINEVKWKAIKGRNYG